ncbi:MAG: HDIG domain-containing metalloprotein [Anaerolineaceae bacterium]
MTDQTKWKQPTRSRFYYLLLLVCVYILTLAALAMPALTSLTASGLQVGQVATQDIRAERTITYESEVRTDQQKELAARSVSPIYTTPDTSIARTQLERLQSALAYISAVRADTLATPEQKLADLKAMEDVYLSEDDLIALLELSDTQWQAVQQEAIVVLEQVMRTTIREDRISDVRRGLPALVSLSLSQEQATIVAKLVSNFVAPNSFYSDELTEAARQEARQAVAPVKVTIQAGELVVQSGRVITEAELEALQQLGLAQPQYSWKDLVAAAAVDALAIGFIVLFFIYRKTLLQQTRNLGIIAFLFLLFLASARLLIDESGLVPYLFPIAAYAMTVAVFFGGELAMISSLPLAILVTYGFADAFILTIYYAFGSMIGVFVLNRARRVTSFFWAGAAVAICGVIVLLAYQFPAEETTLFSAISLTAASLVNGIASASLTILLQFLLAQSLGITTALQLLEISRPDHPLLQFILHNAPGTYQHSLQVANMAEQAAELIGADPLLTRVGALYHDAGKALNPYFFIENQHPGNLNPHDDLDFITSARTIIHHVTDGVELAQKYRLPSRIIDFIREHHGTLTTSYQYVNAVKAAGGDESKVDIDQFRYPGPRPQSRETAILMLADGCEAVVRAGNPQTEGEMRKLIKEMVDKRVAMRQLDDTPLTLRDLNTIVDVFTAHLRGIYHPRIEYPQLEKAIPVYGNPTPTAPARKKEAVEQAVSTPTDSSSNS